MSKTSGYHVSFLLGDRKRWDIVDFGRNINQVLWNHFAFTVDNNARACAYINGVKEKCNSKSVYDFYYVAQNTAVRFGGDGSADKPAMYFDDFAIWKTILTDGEILELYRENMM